MRWLSGEWWMWILAVIAAVWAATRGGRRVRSFLIVLTVVLGIGEGLITGPLKKAFIRPRPFVEHPETRLPPGTGKGTSFSMPSGHAAASAALAVVAVMFYPRSRRWTIPLAGGVGLSRIYNGVHFPSDVIAGWALGATYAWGLALLTEEIWRRAGRRWFPLWWVAAPSVLKPDQKISSTDAAQLDRTFDPAVASLQWLRLGYVLIGATMIGRFAYQAAGVIDLSEDEAYQWLWSKHLDWSYYSKPLGIGLAQWIGTHIAGDTELGVRFLSPLISAGVAVMTLRFLARLVPARTVFWALLGFNAVPVFALGGLMLTVDPLTVFFWSLAMFAGWRAIQEDSTGQWLLVGVGLAGGFLCKYFSPFQIAAFAIVFATWPRARRQLRRPGPWLALGLNLVAIIPVVLWNMQHGRVGLTHLAERGGLQNVWQPTLRYWIDFMLVEPLLFNPFFYVAIGVAVALYGRWRTVLERGSETDPDGAVFRYLLAMGAPVFLFYLGYTLRARVLPNWVAPAILPLLLFALLVGSRLSAAAGLWLRRLFQIGFAVGFPLLGLAHETNWAAKFIGGPLPAGMDPLRRLRGFRETASVVGAEYAKLAASGRPTHILCYHYGYAGVLSFYLPKNISRVGTLDPLVLAWRNEKPNNQLWFWPEYEYRDRQGTDFLVVFQSDEPPTMPLDELKAQFTELTDLGEFPVLYRGREFHRLRLFIGRGLR